MLAKARPKRNEFLLQDSMYNNQNVNNFFLVKNELVFFFIFTAFPYSDFMIVFILRGGWW